MFKNNKIFKVDAKGQKSQIFFIKGLKVKFKGRNSTLVFYDPLPKFKKCIIETGNNCNITIISK